MLTLPPHPGDAVLPIQVTWSPDGTTLLFTTMETAPYPGETVVSLDPASEIRRGLGVRLIDVSSGEMSLLGYLPLTFRDREAGYRPIMWGPTGDVLLNDYHLVIEHHANTD